MTKLKKALQKAEYARNSNRQPIPDKNAALPASETREDTHIAPSVRESAPLSKPSQPAEKKNIRQTDSNEKLSVSYSNTKVVKINPNVFKQNKVFSFFQRTRMADHINTLRTQILNRLSEKGGNTLLVTSANPGEGKTFTSINLGISIARELSRTVLIVDADLRHPAMNHFDFANDFFGVKISNGLSDYLLGRIDIPDIMINPGIERLTILPGGKPMSNSAELLGSPRMVKLIRDMRSRYSEDRIIIFDGPALLACSDPLVLARYVDEILLVVEEENTTRHDLKRVQDLLKGYSIVGAVLNKSRAEAGQTNV